MKCTRTGPSVLRIAVMVMAPLICTNKYDNLSIKLVTTAVRMPRVWDESCKKKREMELYWWYKIYSHDDIQKLLFLVLAPFLKLDHTSIPTFSRLFQYAQLLKREIWFEMRKGDRTCVQTEKVNFINLRFPSSSELKIHQFCIIVVQREQRNLQKSMGHEQSCWFAS